MAVEEAHTDNNDGAKLQNALEQGASFSEVEHFLHRNRKNMAPGCEDVFRKFTPQEQRHVMRRGDLPPDCFEGVLCKRLKESRGMVKKLSNMVANSSRRPGAKTNDEHGQKAGNETVFLPGFEMNTAISMCEVSTAESRFATSALAGSLEEENAETIEEPKEGIICGVGGVIEVTKKKFGCEMGSRLHVLGEKGNLWQCEGGVAIVKFQKDGWKWVLRVDVAEEQARRLKEKEDQKKQTNQENGVPASTIMQNATKKDYATERLRAIGILQSMELKAAMEMEEQVRLHAQELEKRVAKAALEARAAQEAEEVQAASETTVVKVVAKGPKETKNSRKSQKAKKQAKIGTGASRKKDEGKTDSDSDSGNQRKKDKKTKTKNDKTKRKEKENEKERDRAKNKKDKKEQKDKKGKEMGKTKEKEKYRKNSDDESDKQGSKTKKRKAGAAEGEKKNKDKHRSKSAAADATSSDEESSPPQKRKKKKNKEVVKEKYARGNNKAKKKRKKCESSESSSSS